jgi:GT2 family glycosyltransferase
VIVTYRREQVLVETVERVAQLLRPGDELIVVDQTPRHEPATEAALRRMAITGSIRWYRRNRPHICEAMNAGARLARGAILLFLDDDVVPSPGLLEGHRAALSQPDPPPGTCGQVIQSWHRGPVERVHDFDLGFDPGYNQPCDILGPIGCNFGLRRDIFFDVGGIDENFFGPCYRFEAELSRRIFRRTGRKIRFLPHASLVHLKTAGGTRSFGEKDTWKHIGGRVGEYYFALRSLPPLACLGYCLRQIMREPLNKYTLRRPWLIPSLFVREVVAWAWAVCRALTRHGNYAKAEEAYHLAEPAPPPR